MPDYFGGDQSIMFGIDWTGSNGGSYSWGKDDCDETSTCLYGLWKNVRSWPAPLSARARSLIELRFTVITAQLRGSATMSAAAWPHVL